LNDHDARTIFDTPPPGGAHPNLPAVQAVLKVPANGKPNEPTSDPGSAPD
jgi:hypothetical protein